MTTLQVAKVWLVREFEVVFPLSLSLVIIVIFCYLLSF